MSEPAPCRIFFSGGHDFERALDEVVVALEEDLDWRDAHTRLGVRLAALKVDSTPTGLSFFDGSAGLLV